MFFLSKSLLRVIRKFLCSYPLQMTCGGDVNYSADKHLKGSVSAANCVLVWACEALEGLWGLTRYMVVPKVYPSAWWVTAASAAHGFTKLNSSIFHPYLARGFGDHSLSASSLPAKGTHFCAVTFENLASKGHVGRGNIQSILSEVGKRSDLTRCSNLLV